MTLSIADIDSWDPDAISAVSQASSSRSQSAMRASSALGELPAFDSWKGPASTAAMQQTQAHAATLESHGQDASGIAAATRVAANEVNQIKSGLSSLRSTAAGWGIRIDPASSQAFAPPYLDSLPAETKQLVQTMTKSAQACLDRLRTAASHADGLLADALGSGKHDVTVPGPKTQWDAKDYEKNKTAKFGNEDRANKTAGKGPQVKVGEANTRKVGAVADKELIQGQHKFGENGPAVKGNVTLDALTAQAGANAKASSNGLSAGANANATLVGAQAKGSADWGPTHGEVTGGAAVEANANANASIGKDGVSAGAGAFAGGRVTGDAKADVGGVGVGAHAEGQAGIGLSANVNAGMQDGKIEIGGSLGACLGLGAKGSLNIEIDPGKVTHTVEDAAENVAKWLGF